MGGMQTAETAGIPPEVIMQLHQRCRDIKSSNILLDGSGRAKVADVGLACHLNTVGLNAPEGTFVSVSADCKMVSSPDVAGGCQVVYLLLFLIVPQQSHDCQTFLRNATAEQSSYHTAEHLSVGVPSARDPARHQSQ